MGRPTQALIDIDAVHHNLDLLTNMASKSKVIAVVKADAYGNGAVQISQSIEYKVDLFAVAFVSEAIELRAAGITKKILILQGPHQPEDLIHTQAADLIWLLHSEWQLDCYSNYYHGNKLDSTHSAWLKFDTGMHRLGFPLHELSSILNKHNDIFNSQTVIVTHLACADEPNSLHAEKQINDFLGEVEQRGNPMCIANSATNARFPQARQDYVRLGISLYGSTPFPEKINKIENLKPVMQLESQVIALRTIPKGDSVGYGATWQAKRTSKIATVAIGYADGYPRHAPTGTPAWCNGANIALVGRVSMDMLTFDVTDLEQVSIGDKVQLWGEHLLINKVAEHIDTIGYELMTRISKRVPRIYKSSN